MTPVQATPATRQTTPLWVRVFRTVLLGLLLSALVAGSLYLHAKVVPDFTAKLVEDEKENLAGFVGQMSYFAPLFLTMLLPFLVYRKIDRHDGRVQTELTWMTVMVTAVTFLIILPVTSYLSDAELQAALAAGIEVPKRDGGAYDTMLLYVAPWFVRLFIGYGILCLYHSMRAQREKEETALGMTDEIAETIVDSNNAPIATTKADADMPAEDGTTEADTPAV